MRRILLSSLFAAVAAAHRRRVVRAAAGGAGRGGAEGRAGGPGRARPPLFFKEEWKQNEKGGEHAVGPDAVGNPNLEVKMYGPAAKEFLMSGSAGDESNPIHLWTGMCTSPCGATLRHKTSMVDLSGLARIKLEHQDVGLPPGAAAHQAGRRHLAGGRQGRRLPHRLAVERDLARRREAGCSSTSRPA